MFTKNELEDGAKPLLGRVRRYRSFLAARMRDSSSNKTGLLKRKRLRTRSWFLFLASCALAVQVPTRSYAQERSFSLSRVGRVDGTASDLSPISWLTVGRNGTIVVSQPQDHSLRFFSPNGRSVRAVGRQGAGPGEFGSMTLQGWLGDTLWIGDLDTRRLSLITESGLLARTQPWPAGVTFSQGLTRPYPTFIFSVPWALYPDGSVLSFTYLANDQLPNWFRKPTAGSQPFVRTTADGLYKHVVAWIFPTNEECYFSAPGVTRRSLPLCFQPMWAVSSRGNVIALVDVEQSGAREDLVRAVAINAEGDTLFARSIPVPHTRIPRAIADSVRRRFVNAIRRGGGPEVTVSLPSTFPSFQRVLVAVDEKSVWLERGRFGTEREWLILDLKGRSVGELRVPKDLELKAVSAEKVWAIERDNDGLENVVIFSLKSKE